MKNIIEIGRTANAALAARLYAAAQAPQFNPFAAAGHGQITTANATLFVQAHFSEPLTTYATGWRDPEGYEDRSEFLAPTLPPSGERYEHITFPNAEAFLSDGSYDDLRSINADFKTVEYSQDKSQRTIPNRGLRIVLDWDRIKNMPNWQEFYTNMLLQRLARNAFRRKYALAVASAVDVPLVWDAAGAADPDHAVASQAAASGDLTGVRPTSALWGLEAKLLRLQCYGATNAAKAVAGRAMTPEQASAMAGLSAQVDESRYQSSATAKSRIVGSKVLLFTGAPASTMDPSNFKTAKAATQQGGMRAVYVRQLTVKQWEIVVECYETEFAASTLGVRTLSITAA
jgi:hypothetical protein